MRKVILFFIFIVAFASAATYVGDKSCMECHSKEVNEWKGSHHEQAMMVADEKSVKADFNNTSFNYNGIVSRFYKKDGKFMVHTDGPDGKMHDYEIAYTFGIYPLQQYMIKFPNGKIQVLDPTWDNRSKEEGGQKWHHTHKDDNVTAGDSLHWTGPNMNWNYMCADCHSTDLKKNYDAKNRSYDTTWNSINVSCEACHGPASKHLEWSKSPDMHLSAKGFPLSFSASKKEKSEHNDTLVKYLQKKELDVCAKCHSRRSQLDDDYVPGDAFHEHYLPTNLDDLLYFSDGKIDDEVYVYNSFLQSEMYSQGVKCTDCHNPHTLERKAVGDKVCFKCHEPQKYTATTHHKHKTGGKGASCISCHMPARTYMGVDSRNDHSFRVPRPDVSVEIKDIPNACNLCHSDKNASWATDAMKGWYNGKVPTGKQNFAHSLQSLRTNQKDGYSSLYEVLIGDAPTIAKATVARHLGDYPSRQTYTTTMQLLRSPKAIVRRSALRALESFPPKMKTAKLFDGLMDPVKIVRMEAARQLASVPHSELDKSKIKLLEKSFVEYEKALMFSGERPESQLSLGLFYAQRNQNEKAKEAYLEAMHLQPKFVPLYVNYSDFLMKQGKNKDAKKVLDDGILKLPKVGVLYHSLGLWHIREKNKEKAVKAFKKSVELDGNNSRFSYVYAVSIGEKNPKKAIEVLEKVYPVHNGNVQVISGLVYYYKIVGDTHKSHEYENRLKELQKTSIGQ